MESFTIPLNLAEQGPWGLLLGFGAFIVISIAKGWLIPKSLHDHMIASADARATAAESANERLSERAAKLTETNSVLATAATKSAAVGETVEKLVDAIQSVRPGGSA